MQKTNRKAQAAILGLIFAFMLVAIASIMQEPLINFIAIGVNGTGNGTHSSLIVTIIQILPVFIWLIILVAVVALITGTRST